MNGFRLVVQVFEGDGPGLGARCGSSQAAAVYAPGELHSMLTLGKGSPHAGIITALPR